MASGHIDSRRPDQWKIRFDMRKRHLRRIGVDVDGLQFQSRSSPDPVRGMACRDRLERRLEVGE